MSNNLPFDIQVEILRRLPVKWLIQFRSVCKSWKSLIQSSCFIADYRGPVQHLLVRYIDSVENFVSFVDDDTFPHQKVSVPQSVKMPKLSRIVGSSHGLLCLYGDVRYETSFDTGRAVVWNPFIRKAVSVDVPNVLNATPNFIYGTVLGFGVCRETCDPKIVKITYFNNCMDVECINRIPWQVEVFTLSTRAWRSPYSNLNLPHNKNSTIQFEWMQGTLEVDGFIYWLATDMHGGGFRSYIIISIDMTSEEFKEVKIPHSLQHNMLSMSRLRESVVVAGKGGEETFDVWMMENIGVQKQQLFTKLFTFNIPATSVRGFRKTGQPLIEVHNGSTTSLATYDPYLNSINDVMVIGMDYYFFQVCSYIESLLLL